MITLNELIKAGIKIEEKMTGVIEYSSLDGLEELTFDDLETGNYATYEVEETYYDNAISSWFIETPDLRGYELNIEDFRNIAESVDSIDEFIEKIQEIYG